MSKNLCSYCGRASGTNAPFPRRELPGQWKLVICPKCHSLENIQLTSRKPYNEWELSETLIAQHRGEMRRKMVSNAVIEIMFWFDPSDALSGFQYTFPCGRETMTLTWNIADNSCQFHRVFSERRRLLTNTLIPEATMPKAEAIRLFYASSGNLDESFRDTMLSVLQALPEIPKSDPPPEPPPPPAFPEEDDEARW